MSRLLEPQADNRLRAAIAFVSGSTLLLAVLSFTLATGDYFLMQSQESELQGDRNRAISLGQKSLSISPGNAKSLDNLGYLLLKRGLADSKHRPNDMALAGDRLKEASIYRPLWPYSDINLAYLAEAEGNIEQVEISISDAYRKGRYDRRIAYEVMMLGLTHWDEMSLSTQQLITDSTNTSMLMKRNDFETARLKLAAAESRIQICEQLSSPARERAGCSSEIVSPHEQPEP